MPHTMEQKKAQYDWNTNENEYLTGNSSIQTVRNSGHSTFNSDYGLIDFQQIQDEIGRWAE